MKNQMKELRQLYQWSQSDLARELGVSRQAVNGFESGKFDPSLDMAFKIANLLNVPIENVFTYEAKNSMQTLLERFTNFLGFNFGFERFTEQAINVVKFAHNQASRSQQLQVEPEHLLSGLLADPTTTSAQLLRANGATLDIEINDRSYESHGQVKFSPKSKFIIELALQIVRLQGKKSIEPEHLLWGLLRLAETDKNTWSELLQRYEVDTESLNNQLTESVLTKVRIGI
jgi:putative transcriptional regulator